MFTNDQVLLYIEAPKTPKDRNAVALMNKIVGHVPKTISVWLAMFLKFKNSSNASRVTGEKVNRGDGYRLEIPSEYLVESDTRDVD